MIFFDIETVSVYDHKERWSKHFKDLHEKYGDKLYFMPEYNKVAVIAFACVEKDGSTTLRNTKGTEKEQIDAFFKYIWSKTAHHICGYNIKKFDIIFLIKRALHHKIHIPRQLKFFGKKPWEMEHIIDLWDVYNHNMYGTFGSMDLVSNFLGITNPKEAWVDGSMVQWLYDEGKLDEIKEYCRRDVQANIDLYKYFREYNLI